LTLELITAPKNMIETYIFKAKGFLEKSYLDKDGAKHTTFEWPLKEAIEIAKLELMGRDLLNFRPVLLEATIRIADEQPGTEPKPKVKRRSYKG
jgi:hypothetical protein